MSANRRQLALWSCKEQRRFGPLHYETKAERIERVAAEMRARYKGQLYRARILKAWRTRRARQLQEVLPFDC
jgi:hypothetical protein